MNNDTDTRTGSANGRSGPGASDSAPIRRGPDERGTAQASTPIGSMPAHELKAIFEPSEMF